MSDHVPVRFRDAEHRKRWLHEHFNEDELNDIRQVWKRIDCKVMVGWEHKKENRNDG